MEHLFKNDAKSIVDCLFNTKVFKDEVTRDIINELEELVRYMLQSRFESYVKIEALNKRIEANKK